MEVEGRTVELFADGPDVYLRLGRYQPLPESERSPVAGNPSASLRYVGTDVVDHGHVAPLDPLGPGERPR